MSDSAPPPPSGSGWVYGILIVLLNALMQIVQKYLPPPKPNNWHCEGCICEEDE